MRAEPAAAFASVRVFCAFRVLRYWGRGGRAIIKRDLTGAALAVPFNPVCQHFDIFVVRRAGEHGQEHEVVREDDNLPVLSLRDQASGDAVFTLMILGGHRIVENDAGIGGIKRDFGQKIGKRYRSLLAFAQNLVRAVPSLDAERTNGLPALSLRAEFNRQVAIQRVAFIRKPFSVVLSNDGREKLALLVSERTGIQAATRGGRCLLCPGPDRKHTSQPRAAAVSRPAGAEA